VQIGTAVLVKVSVSVGIWQYVNSGLVGVQIGTAVLVKVSVSAWNWQYGNSGMVGVQIGTAVLVRVSVFRNVQLIGYSLNFWTAWTVKVEGAICWAVWKLNVGQCGVKSEVILTYSGYVENKL
jgi:hypothetical protein